VAQGRERSHSLVYKKFQDFPRFPGLCDGPAVFKYTDKQQLHNIIYLYSVTVLYATILINLLTITVSTANALMLLPNKNDTGWGVPKIWTISKG